MSSVVVVPYDPAWRDHFQLIRAELRVALSSVPIVEIEHVGSTSVPGLAAKPVIDVDVVVDPAHVDAAIEALVAVGYSHRGDLGVPDRHSMQEPGGIRRNVYVVVDGSLALRNHRAVRNTLRSNPTLRERYAARKFELAQTDWESVDDYAVAKSGIIQEILAAAGLSESDRAAIQAVNQDTRPS